jgi:hypothetical protein
LQSKGELFYNTDKALDGLFTLLVTGRGGEEDTNRPGGQDYGHPEKGVRFVSICWESFFRKTFKKKGEALWVS